ncbi:MAG: Tim44 domain-containing protein, partial [Pseudomonadota bacterium]
KVRKIKPYLFMHQNNGALHEGSTLVVSITAHMRDYLADRATGKVIEGSKRFKDVETFWTFVLTNGEWIVANIEEQDMWSIYANMRHDLPNIKDTVLTKIEV